MSSAILEVGGSQFVLSNSHYTISFDVTGNGHARWDQFHHGTSPQPVTVLPLKQGQAIDSNWIKATVEQMLAADDVFDRGFLSNLLFQTPAKSSARELNLADDVKVLLASWGASARFFSCENQLPNAPYFLSGTSVFQVLKILPDPQQAFMFGIIPREDDPEKFQQLHLSGIPVPSRLYFGPPTPSEPLLGKRVAVKDVFNIAGTETSASCRAFASFYGESNSTAESVAMLQARGAVLVGKTRTAQFASGEDPMDWVDYKCPFNPRGDGSLSPYGSSTGSASAVAAYDWLDFSIGTDTLGSIIAPACGQGLFGVRPTHGTLPIDGAVTVCSLFDVPGYFSRDIRDLESFGAAWHGHQNSDGATKASEFPKKILYAPERFAGYPASKLEMMHLFIGDLERASGLKQTIFDVSKLWDSVTPHPPIQDFLSTTLAHIQLRSHYKNSLRFMSDYERDHGHAPYINPMVRWKWKYGASLTDAQYREACKERIHFKQFVEQHVFNEQEIMVLPGGPPEAMYYGEYLGSPEEKGKDLQGFGFQKNNVYSVLAGLPMLAIPIGQQAIESRTTGAKIQEPVAVTIVGPPGSELELMNFVRRALELGGRPLAVKTGPDCF